MTHLLVATKQLLETLTQWSRGSATETEVSDVYVRLGYEFNIASRAFNGVGIETADLGPVPDILRGILEETLSQEATQASLDRFLPRIRDIIINLLHGLKRKQQKLRQQTGRNGGSLHDRRTGSLTSTISSMGDDADNRSDTKSEPGGRVASNEILREPPAPPSSQQPPQPQPFPHFAANTVPPSPTRNESMIRPENILASPEPRRTGSGRNAQQYPQPNSDSTITTNGVQRAVMPGPYRHDTPPPAPPSTGPPRPTRALAEPSTPSRAPHKQQDALAALQRGGELERRASRRFSAYQIQKHLGTSSSGVPMIPPTQRSPIPNRGRDMRESMNAVRTRETQRGRFDGGAQQEAPQSTSAEPVITHREGAHEPPSLGVNRSSFPPATFQTTLGSAEAREPEANYAKTSFYQSEDADRSAMRATIVQPWEHHFPIPEVVEPGQSPVNTPQGNTPIQTAPTSEIVPAEISPKPKSDPTFRQSRPVEALTLFLQYKTKVKKFVLTEGFHELSVARLQLAFIEKFAWNTHSNGVDLPEIYIQDPVSGVRHELEDLRDVKDHSVLVLNVDNVDEVKRHFDESFVGLRTIIEGVKAAVDDQQATLQRVQDKQQTAANSMARFAPTPPQPSFRPAATGGPLPKIKGSASQIAEVEILRRDLAVLRQTYASNMTDMESAMNGFRAKAASVKTAALNAAVPSVEGSSGRAYVDAGKKSLGVDSEKIINRVDDLQDTVEDLRKDVVTRGVRPLPRQLETVSKDISAATAELRRLRDYLKREKPVWTKVGENELKAVCEDQDMLRIQEELAVDLEDDLEKASQTFALVEEATKQQNLQAGPTATSRNASRTLNPVPDVDPHKAKDTVLGEVRALQPNHESRLEAIERAERSRQVQLEERSNNAFTRELGQFVEDSKLKKTGGVEEAERLRIVRDERARKENYERMAARAAGLEMPVDAPMQDGNADESGGLDVPERDDGAVSPEPEFVEAEEEAPVLSVDGMR